MEKRFSYVRPRDGRVVDIYSVAREGRVHYVIHDGASHDSVAEDIMAVQAYCRRLVEEGFVARPLLPDLS